MTLNDALRSIGYSVPYEKMERVTRIPKPIVPRLFLAGETEFSRRHAALTASHQCWICLFPIGLRSQHNDLWRSNDHVIPRSEGGTTAADNIRIAHRYCNAVRKSNQVTPRLVRICRQHMINQHREFLIKAGVEKSSGLRYNIYGTMTHHSWDHSKAFMCRMGAD